MLQGLSSLIMLTVVYAICLYFNTGEDKARAITFITMVASNLSLILTNRSWSQSIIRRSRDATNKPIYVIVTLALLVLILINYIPFLTSLFRFTQLNLIELILAIVGGFGIVIWFEILKALKLVHG